MTWAWGGGLKSILRPLVLKLLIDLKPPPPVILLLAVPRRLFCFGSLVILDVVCRYLSLFLLYFNFEIVKIKVTGCAISSFRQFAVKRRHAKRRKDEKNAMQKDEKTKKMPCEKTKRRNNAMREDKITPRQKTKERHAKRRNNENTKTRQKNVLVRSLKDNSYDFKYLNSFSV